jgi:hypothetical protein
MKKIFFSFLYCTLIATSSFAQQNKLSAVNENKYRINLPDYWGKGNKVWGVLTDKLPLVCEELKDKDLCGDNCKPKYVVDFYISEPEVTGYSIYRVPQYASTNTRLLATPIPVMTSSTYIPPAIVNNQRAYSPPESLKLVTEYQFQCFLILKNEKDSILTKLILVDTNEVWFSDYNGKDVNEWPYSLENPASFIEKNKEKLFPNKFELLAIADKKILAL